MTTEEKARRYDEALNWMREIYPGLHGATKEDAEHFFPELTESEDERVIRALETFLNQQEIADKITFEARIGWLTWLEKQKENHKSVGSIPTDCVSDVKYEDRWHKVEDSLPDNGREVLAKDNMGNLLLAGYDGEGWDVSVYDDEDYRCHNGVSKWCEIPPEKQKEQKPLTTEETELNSIAFLEQMGYTCIPPRKEQKPAEWKPQPESLEALMYAIEGKWDVISPTSYLSRRLEDLYEGLVNTYNVDESLLSELPEAASCAYTAEDIEELRELKRKIEASMEQKPVEKQDYSGLNDLERAILRGFLSAGVENVTGTTIKETAKECLAQIKTAEWSEEDKKILDGIITTLDRLGYTEYCESSRDQDIEEDRLYYKEIQCLKKLKSLGPRQIQNVSDMITPNKKFFQWIYNRLVYVHNENPDVDYMRSFKERIEELSFDKSSWKPSDEQKEALEYVIRDYREDGCNATANYLQEVLDHLKNM